MARRLRSLLLFLVLKVGAGGTALALAQTSEADLKAAFIFTLTKYVDWPARRLIRGRPLELSSGVASAALAGCHVLVNPALPLKARPFPDC
jgi:hypothetical protein